MLKETLKVSILQSSKSKIENQLRKEKVENGSHQAQIKKLPIDFSATERKPDKGSGTQKLLNEKENTIPLLKKKVKIPSTQLIQASELTKLEKEKEYLNDELTECKENLLKFAEKEKQWKKYVSCG